MRLQRSDNISQHRHVEAMRMYSGADAGKSSYDDAIAAMLQMEVGRSEDCG
jgi:hypothetical protein